ncbi:MAG: DUF427 domain-containing protein [Acidimicrobiales bacterium]|nr:DUF427 domain-containing protein [Acidimicrobiales bacterium]
MNPDRIEPGPGQESVWDYPRPPRIEPTDAHIRVGLGGETVADTRRAVRVLETSQPPAFYLPPDDVRTDLLVPTTTRTFCEWKGQAIYYTVRAGGVEAQDAAWTYATPVDAFAPIAGWFAFYAQQLDCSVDDEHVTANEGSYYGGWITSAVVGPFKGGTGTSHW